MENRLNQCTHVKPDGTRCRAAALKGAEFCFCHSPATAEARLEARRRGARIRNARRPHPETAALIQRVKHAAKAGPVLITPLVDAFLKVRDGLMDTRTANSLAYLATILSQMGEVQPPDDGPPKTRLQRAMPNYEAIRCRLLDWDSPFVMQVARSLGINERIPLEDPRIHQIVQRMYDLQEARTRPVRAVPQGSDPQGGGLPKTLNVTTPSAPGSSANTPEKK